jgi:5-methylcytosine-specific restriction endonuclease McrA
LERRKKLKNARERGEFDVSVTLENVYEKFGGKCVCCGKSLKFGDSPLTEDYPTIDHIKPLSKGGAHLWNNVQLMCRACNMSKGAKYDDRQAEATA